MKTACPEKDYGYIMQRYSAVIFFAALLLFNMIFTKNFVALNTLWNAIVQSATIMLLSMGMMLVIATGGIDISLGSVAAFSSTLLVLLNNAGFGLASVGVAVAAGAMIGLLSGFIIASFKIQPLIVTLAFMTSIRGMAQLISNGALIPLRDPVIQKLAYYRIGGVVPVQLIIIAAVILIFFLLCKKNRFGLCVEAYGDNSEAVRLVGVRTDLLLMGVYMTAGLMAGLGGVIETARISAADPSNIGMNMEMDAIAATAIGGTPMNGGKIHIGGTVVGVFLMQIITMMVNMNNVPYETSLIMKAAIIVFAVYIQNVKRRAARKRVVNWHG